MMMGVEQEKANGQFEQCAYRPMKANGIIMIDGKEKTVKEGTMDSIYKWETEPCRSKDAIIFWNNDKKLWTNNDTAEILEALLKWNPEDYSGVKKFASKYGFINYDGESDSKYMPYETFKATYTLFDLLNGLKNCVSDCSSNEALLDGLKSLINLICWGGYPLGSEGRVYDDFSRFPYSYINFKMDWMEEQKQNVGIRNEEILGEEIRSKDLTEKDYVLLYMYITGKFVKEYEKKRQGNQDVNDDGLKEFEQAQVEMRKNKLIKKAYILLYMYITRIYTKECGNELQGNQDVNDDNVLKEFRQILIELQNKEFIEKDYISLYLDITNKFAKECGNKPQGNHNQDVNSNDVQKEFEQALIEIRNKEFTEKAYILLHMYMTRKFAKECGNKPQGNQDVNDDDVQKEFEQALIEIRNCEFTEKEYILLYMHITHIFAKECRNKLEDNQYVNDDDVLKEYRQVLIEMQNKEFTDNAYILLYMYITRVFAEECGNKPQGNQYVNGDNALKEFKSILIETQNNEFTDRAYILVYMYIIRILAKDCRNKLQVDQHVYDDNTLKEFERALELYWRKRKESEGKAEEQKAEIRIEDYIEEDLTEQEENDEKALAKDTIQKYGKIIGIELPNNFRSPTEKEKSRLRIERLEAIIKFANLVEKMAGRICLSKESQENKIFSMEPDVFNDEDKKLIRQLSRFFIQDICNTILRVNSVPRLILDKKNKLRVKETFELDTLGALTRAFMYTSVIEGDKRKCCRCGEPFFGEGDLCSDKCKKKYKRNVKKNQSSKRRQSK